MLSGCEQTQQDLSMLRPKMQHSLKTSGFRGSKKVGGWTKQNSMTQLPYLASLSWAQLPHIRHPSIWCDIETKQLRLSHLKHSPVISTSLRVKSGLVCGRMALLHPALEQTANGSTYIDVPPQCSDQNCESKPTECPSLQVDLSVKEISRRRVLEL